MQRRTYLIFLLVLLVALSNTVASASAPTVAERVQEQLQPYSGDMSSWYGWGVEERIRFLHLMQNWGVEVDAEALEALEQDYDAQKDALTLDLLDDLEDRAGAMIYAWYGPPREAFSSRYAAEQTDKYPMPDDLVVYTYLYRALSPEASDEEIEESYKAWSSELREAYVPEPTPEKTVSQGIMDSLWENFDVMGLGSQEIRRIESSISFDAEKRVYLVESQVLCQYITESNKERILRDPDEYREVPLTDGEHFYWHFYYDEEGKYLGENLEQIEYEALIPWPDTYILDDGTLYGDPDADFARFSLERRAQFSRDWKPVVDAWLEEHPGYAAYLAGARERGAFFDATYRQTRHWHGVPPQDALQQEDIERIAKEWFLNLHPEVPEAFFDEFEEIFSYYVLTDEGAEWKVEMYCNSGSHDTSNWTETELEWWRIGVVCAVFDTEGGLLRAGDDLLHPEDDFELNLKLVSAS